MPELSLRDQTILVTGGAGFLGGRIVRRLREQGCERVIVPRSRDCDLTREANVQGLFDANQVRVVIHCASMHGGVEFNIKHRGEIYFHNVLMSTLLMEYARRAGVEKFVSLGTVDAYPRHAAMPLKEESFWDGYPESTSASYAFSKKMMQVQGQAYREQFGWCAIHLLLMNLYGPGDEFDLDTCHVIPALIQRIDRAMETGQRQLVVWGDGSQRREFFHVDDAAEGVMRATEAYNAPEPINIGTGCDIAIREVVERLTAIMGFQGEIVWDTSRPSGTSRKQFDVSKARTLLGFVAKKDFQTGLRETVAWYYQTYKPAQVAPSRAAA